MIVTFWTVALDTTRTPFKTVERILGGAATYNAIAASFFDKIGLIAIVGNDFPENYRMILQDKMDLTGFVTTDGKTFYFDSQFDYDLSKRTALVTEENVIKTFEPKVPEEYKKADFVYLGNNNPKQNTKILEQFDHPKITVCDTIEYWIQKSRDDVIKMISNTRGVVLNDDEVRMLFKTHNLIKCARKVLELGPEFIIIKKGEHGAIFFSNDIIFLAPGYPLDTVVDPTGAGDSFAGGFLGHIGRKNSIDQKTLKEAVIYGNVMGSFAVEDFGINKFLTITNETIEERYKIYREFLTF